MRRATYLNVDDEVDKIKHFKVNRQLKRIIRGE